MRETEPRKHHRGPGRDGEDQARAARNLFSNCEIIGHSTAGRKWTEARSSLSCRVGIDLDVRTPVLLAAFGGVVVVDGMVRPVADGAHTVGGKSVFFDEILFHRFRPLLREFDVMPAGPA